MGKLTAHYKKVIAVLVAFSAVWSLLLFLQIKISNNDLKGGYFSRVAALSVQYVENMVYDSAFSIFGVLPADDRIFIVAIDEDTTKKLGFPFPRKYYGKIIEELNKVGVRTIAFDVLFPDKDRDDSQSDKMFSDAVKKAGNVVLTGQINIRNLEKGDVFEFSPPFGELGRVCCLLSTPNVDDVVDGDGHIRRIVLNFGRVAFGDIHGACCRDCKGMRLPSLSLAAYAHYMGMSLQEVYKSLDSSVKWLHLVPCVTYSKRPGGKSDEYIWASYMHVSILDIIEGRLTKEQKELMKGGIGFIASTTVGAYDHYPTPFNNHTPGVEFHANSLDNLLNNQFMKLVPPFWIYAALLFMIAAAGFTFRMPPFRGALLITGIFIIWTFLYAVLITAGIKNIYVIPLTGMLGAYAFATIYRAVVEGKEKRWIKNTFGQYLSPKVVEVLMKDPAKLKLGGEKREMTVFFLDIAHFTNISEKMDPEKLTAFLNRYLSALTAVILKNEGVVDKYIGDCIMAFWNAPLDLKEHKLMGCISAVECLEAVEKLNQEHLSGIPEIPAVRIGLNSGQMVVGNMGSNMRFSYTVIGDEVNLASRLEGANKFFGSRVIASESAYSGGRSAVEARKLGSIRVVGKAVPVTVYELLGRKGGLPENKARLLAAFSQGTEYFYKREFGKAAVEFKGALSAMPDDMPSRMYLKLSEDYQSVPPAAEWDGVFNLTSK